MNKKVCKMVTFDTSTKVTGFAVYENGILKRHGEFNFEEDLVMDSRFPKMSIAILDFLNKEKPDILYLEDTKVRRNAVTERFLTRLTGVVYGWCITNNCEYNIWPPTHIRKLLGFVQGKNTERNDLKSQAIQYVYDKYKIWVKEDQADAICIGEAVLIFFKNLAKNA